MNRYADFIADVNRAYEQRIACPVTQEYFSTIEGKTYACAIAAAYLVNNPDGKQALQETPDEENFLFNWAIEHYHFIPTDLQDIIKGFDSQCDHTEAAKVGCLLYNTWFPESDKPIVVE